MASPRDSFIIHNGAAPDQLGAFQAAALARSSSRVESVFPERALGRCRICGKVAVRNEEHVPPRSAYNKGRFTDLPIFTMLTGDRQPPSQHVPTQGRTARATPCASRAIGSPGTGGRRSISGGSGQLAGVWAAAGRWTG